MSPQPDRQPPDGVRINFLFDDNVSAAADALLAVLSAARVSRLPIDQVDDAEPRQDEAA